MTAPPRSEKAGDRITRCPGEGGGAADVLKAPFGVVPAEQQTAGSGHRAGDRTAAPRRTDERVAPPLSLPLLLTPRH
ncbi:hypothetical protein ACFV2U_28840 [Streptomyces sp. NPDC059697]|uniref:hypothetical protein n=1 Tax=Streptomyces sp. NPDC059697 TaxID=3346912 RepID=UPI003687EAF4